MLVLIETSKCKRQFAKRVGHGWTRAFCRKKWPIVYQLALPIVFRGAHSETIDNRT